jgi:hypothetical protein
MLYQYVPRFRMCLAAHLLRRELLVDSFDRWRCELLHGELYHVASRVVLTKLKLLTSRLRQRQRQRVLPFAQAEMLRLVIGSFSPNRLETI